MWLNYFAPTDILAHHIGIGYSLLFNMHTSAHIHFNSKSILYKVYAEKLLRLQRKLSQICLNAGGYELSIIF